MPRPVCLLCEEEMLISIDVETCLDGIGVAVAGPFASGADALAWAATNKPDVAVLDYTLRDGECLPLIRVLQEQQVPIVIHSGWRPHEVNAPPEISGLPWVTKPMDHPTLQKMLAEAAPQIFPKT
jgi:DNA-binding response OmpR family regulator